MYTVNYTLYTVEKAHRLIQVFIVNLEVRTEVGPSTEPGFL